MPEIYIASTSPEDDAAFIALEDISRLLTQEDDGCIIGGHMISLLGARYPSPGLVDRHTGDADAGIPVELAQSGGLHDRLVAAGYEPNAGNRYLMLGDGPQPTIDLIAPGWLPEFGSEVFGERAFDTMPGLPLALTFPLTLDVVATMRDGSERAFPTRVPTVEAAIVLKAITWGLRLKHSDAVDLHNLFCIVRAGHDLGAWRLDESPLSGSRRDAARHLHSLADGWETRPPQVQFDWRLLVASVRAYVTRP